MLKPSSHHLNRFGKISATLIDHTRNFNWLPTTVNILKLFEELPTPTSIPIYISYFSSLLNPPFLSINYCSLNSMFTLPEPAISIGRTNRLHLVPYMRLISQQRRQCLLILKAPIQLSTPTRTNHLNSRANQATPQLIPHRHCSDCTTSIIAINVLKSLRHHLRKSSGSTVPANFQKATGGGLLVVLRREQHKSNLNFTLTNLWSVQQVAPHTTCTS